jgi:thymidine phosphorylase
MDTPLGRAAGNWLEVKESVACCLEPNPRSRVCKNADDLRELVLTCAAHLLAQTRKSKSLGAARKQAEKCLASGAPRKKWDEMLAAQGADLDAFNRKLALDHTAPVVVELKAASAGYVSRCDARLIGEVIRDLGGGRLTKESAINYDVGVDKIAKPGEYVKKNSVLARIHAANRAQADNARNRLNTAFEVSVQSPVVAPLVAEIVAPK